MKAIILAAGRGSRMKSLSDESPKCLVQVRGKSLLEWQAEALHAAGIQDVAIVTGYKREQLAGRNMREFYNPRWAETNMVSSLACAAEWLSAAPCIVSYSDIFYDASAVAALMNCPADIAITYDPNWRALWQKRFEAPLLDAETLRLNADGSLAEIGQRPKTLEEVEGQYMGLLRFTPKGWYEVQQILSTLPSAERDIIHMTGTLQKIIAAGRMPILALPYEKEWGEVDSKEDLAVYDH